jgi:hypothetical protein
VIRPVLKAVAFLDDVRSAPGDRINLWWLGQSGYLVQWHGHHLLLDPYLSDSLTEKYRYTARPHVRMTERVIAPRKLDFIEVVTSSHNHTDHLDGETLIPLLQANPALAIIASTANLQFAAGRLQVQPERLTPIHADGDPSPSVLSPSLPSHLPTNLLRPMRTASTNSLVISFKWEAE